MQEVQINRYANPRIKLNNSVDDNFKGKEICSSRFFQAFIVARKNSGKTNALLNLIKYRTDKRKDTIIIFSATVEKDPLYVETIKTMRNRGYRIITFTSIFDDNDENLVEELVGMLTEVHPQSRDPFGENADEEEEVKEEKPKPKTKEEIFVAQMNANMKQQPEENEEDEDRKITYNEENPFDWITEDDQFFIVFDDMPTEELRNRSVVNLMKKNRHLKTQIVVSSQWVKDITPSQRSQIDCWMIFGGQNDDNLRLILNTSGIGIEFNEFKNIYEYATKQKYNFLLVDARTGDKNKYFRRNFDMQIIPQ